MILYAMVIKADLECAVVTLDDRDEPLCDQLVGHHGFQHTQIPEVHLFGADCFGLVIELLQGQCKISLEGEIEPEIEYFLGKIQRTDFIASTTYFCRPLTNIPNSKTPIDAI